MLRSGPLHNGRRLFGLRFGFCYRLSGLQPFRLRLRRDVSGLQCGAHHADRSGRLPGWPGIRSCSRWRLRFADRPAVLHCRGLELQLLARNLRFAQRIGIHYSRPYHIANQRDHCRGNEGGNGSRGGRDRRHGPSQWHGNRIGRKQYCDALQSHQHVADHPDWRGGVCCSERSREMSGSLSRIVNRAGVHGSIVRLFGVGMNRGVPCYQYRLEAC